VTSSPQPDGGGRASAPQAALQVALQVALGLALTALAVAWVLAASGPPPPRPADAPAGEFAALRAWADVEAMSRAAHPLGSAEHARVRQHVVARLRQLGADAGLQVEVQEVPLPQGDKRRAARNVLARLPGRDGGPALMLSAHYDGWGESPAAADDSAAVAALLEVLRALLAGAAAGAPPPAHDVLFVITDGEESAFEGAQGFLRHRWAADVGAVLNFDARGVRGPVLMYETGPDSAWLVRALGQAPRPRASSLFPALYAVLPQSTDFTFFRRAGLPGLNFAFIEGYGHYHTPSDDLAHLDPASLQHEGELALALTRRLADLDLAAARRPGDAVYFDLAGRSVVQWPRAWVIPLALVVLALAAAVVALALRRGRLAAGGLLRGFVLFPAVAVGAAVLATAAGWIYAASAPLLPHSRQPAGLELFGLALLAAVTLAVVAAVGWLARRTPAAELAVGAWGWWGLALVVLSVALPGASYLALVPLAAAAVALALRLPATGAAAPRLALRLAALLVALLPAALLLAPPAAALWQALGPRASGLVALLEVAALTLPAPFFTAFPATRPATGSDADSPERSGRRS